MAHAGRETRRYYDQHIKLFMTFPESTNYNEGGPARAQLETAKPRDTPNAGTRMPMTAGGKNPAQTMLGQM